MRRGYEGRLAFVAVGLMLAATAVMFSLLSNTSGVSDDFTPSVRLDIGSAPAEPARPQQPLPEFHATSIEAVSEAPAQRLTYIDALAARDRGATAEAVAAFREVAESDHALAPFARLRLAQVLAASGDPAAAVPHFMQAAEDEVLTRSLQRVALSEGATALVQSGDTAGALAALQRLGELPGTTDTQRAGTIWRSALIHRYSGDAAWVDLAHTAISTAPGSETAVEALNTINDAGIGHAALEAAHVRYRANEDERARQIYQAIVDGDIQPSPGGPGIATAWYYLGVLAEERGEEQAAVEAYSRSVDIDPLGFLADDALYWRGRLAEVDGDRDLAVASYDRLASDHPTSKWAAEAEQRAAVAVAKAGDIDAALDRFEGLAARHNGEPAAEAARWHAALSSAFGKSDRPDLDATREDPMSFAAALARSGAVTAPLPDESLAESPAAGVDVAEAERWLDETFGEQEGPGLLEGPTYRMITEMEAAGEEGAARTLLFKLIEESEGRPHDLFHLGRLMLDQGNYSAAMDAASLLLEPLTPERRVSAPPAVHQLSYPAPFTHELVTASTEQGIPSLLLLALVRQESRFNPRAGSHAGALGLTQVIGPTGELIAKSLGVPWDIDSLYDPATSLRFGAHYLAVQLDVFDGNVMAALAAYNAGPGAAARWLREQQLPGAEGYMATIDYAETRLYVEVVLENYAWYRYVYAGAEKPSIR